jgi:hypothetical protein
MSNSNFNTVFTESPNFSVTLLKDRLGERNLIKRVRNKSKKKEDDAMSRKARSLLDMSQNNYRLNAQ